MVKKGKVLDHNTIVFTALPCRRSIYEEGGKTMLITLKPTTLLAMFNTSQLEGVAYDIVSAHSGLLDRTPRAAARPTRCTELAD
jgi:uncharacterized protein (DUF302 family)